MTAHFSFGKWDIYNFVFMQIMIRIRRRKNIVQMRKTNYFERFPFFTLELFVQACFFNVISHKLKISRKNKCKKYKLFFQYRQHLLTKTLQHRLSVCLYVIIHTIVIGTIVKLQVRTKKYKFKRVFCFLPSFEIFVRLFASPYSFSMLSRFSIKPIVFLIVLLLLHPTYCQLSFQGCNCFLKKPFFLPSSSCARVAK